MRFLRTGSLPEGCFSINLIGLAVSSPRVAFASSRRAVTARFIDFALDFLRD